MWEKIGDLILRERFVLKIKKDTQFGTEPQYSKSVTCSLHDFTD